MNAYTYGPNFTPAGMGQTYGTGALSPELQTLGAPAAPGVMPVGAQPVPVPGGMDALSTQLGAIPGLQGGGTPAMPGAAGTPAAPGEMGRLGGFWNGMGGMQGFAGLLQGLGGLGQVYTSLNGLGLAKDQMEMQRDAYQTNLANSTKSYNTELTDRAQTRFRTEGRSQAELDAYVRKNAL